MDPVSRILGQMTEEQKQSYYYVEEFSKRLATKYKVSKAKAKGWIDKASAYNITSEGDVFHLIDSGELK